MADPAPPSLFHAASPILPVSDLAKSLDYYVRVLGFAVDWQDATGMASVTRDGCALMLCQGDQGHAGTWVWVGVTDVDALHEDLKARGAIVRHPPSDYPWAREMQIADRTATCCASAQTHASAPNPASGSTCTASAGRRTASAPGSAPTDVPCPEWHEIGARFVPFGTGPLQITRGACR